MHRVIFHLDMDAFYASIEQRDNPSLMGRPVVVGASPERRGVVCAASYEARSYGVRSAMPSSTAHRLCPHAVFLRPRMDCYKQVSASIMKIIGDFGVIIEQISIDEAYLDVSQLLPDAEVDVGLMASVPIAKGMKKVVREKSGLTASIGIASNKFLAKLASDFDKPDGLTLIPERDKSDFLRPFPVRAIQGVGKVLEQILEDAGIKTIAHLQDYEGDLRTLVGSFGPTLKNYSAGIDDRPLDLSDEITGVRL